jgi:hypothetical protein
MSVYRHGKNGDAVLFLQLADPTTLDPVTGASPEVQIRRHRHSQTGALLDGWYWNGTNFTFTPTWLPMAEFDAVNTPGLYLYFFEQSLVSANQICLAYVRNTVNPEGFDVEEHIFTDEVTIYQGTPVVPISPTDTVMGKLAGMEVPTGPVALANADAVWDEPLSEHTTPGTTGAALNACAGGMGAYQIDLSVVDSATSDPIPGAQIDVFRPDDSFLMRVWVDVNGERSIGLDTGSYNLIIFASGYNFTTPTVLAVTANAPFEIQGTSVIPPPAGPDYCVIYGTVRNAAGDPIVNACVEAYSIVPQVVDGVQHSEQIASENTDVNGQFTMPLLRDTVVRFIIETTGVDEIRTVPDADTQDIATWTAP